jgi:hypothetical protein
MITVKTPKGEHFLANLRPRQGMTVEMAYPPKAQPGEDWGFFIDSDFLRLKRTDNNQFGRTFEFEQIFDLKRWHKKASIYLGEIIFRWNGQGRPGSHSRLLTIICPGDTDAAQDTLLVINPVGRHVRIYPHQKVEVVLTAQVYNQPLFKVRVDNNAGDRPAQFLDIQQTDRRTVSYSAIDNQFTIVQGNLADLVRATAALDYCPAFPEADRTRQLYTGPYRATHYDFSLTPAAIGQVYRLKNGSYPSATITIQEERADGLEFAMDIEVMVRGNKKKRLPPVNKSYRTAYGEPMIDARRVLERERVVSPSGKLLACPDLEDTWEFVEGQDNHLTVDLPPPAAYCPTAGADERWTASVDPVWLFGSDHKATTRLKCTPVADRTYDGKTIQRYRISPVEDELLPPHVRMRTLGQINFRPAGGGGSRRTICFYLVASPRVADTNRPVAPRSTYQYTPPTPTYTAVTIEEITTPGLMAPGGRMSRFSEVKAGTCSTGTGKKKDGTIPLLPP